jgi:hypothetical protein
MTLKQACELLIRNKFRFGSARIESFKSRLSSKDMTFLKIKMLPFLGKHFNF